jgi:hypothetical protein
MITKKFQNKTFVWDPSAFRGRGYWFILGSKGAYGRAASKKEAAALRQPKSENIKTPIEEPNNPVSEDTGENLNEMTNKFDFKKIGGMFGGLGSKIKDKFTGKKEHGNFFGDTNKKIKETNSPSAGRKVGNIDTALYTSIEEGTVKRLRRGDGIADVSSKLMNLVKKNYEDRKIKIELSKNFDEEAFAEEERRFEKLRKELEKINTKKVDKKKKALKKLEKEENVKQPKSNKSSLVKTGAIVTAGVVGTIATGSVMAKIGSTEGTYTSMNAVASKGEYESKTYDVKAGQKSYSGKKYEKNLTDMTIDEVLLLADERKGQFGGSGAGTAAGKYQFMPDTIQGSMMKNGKRAKGLAEQTFGPDWRNVKFSAENQDKMEMVLINNQATQLKSAGVPVSEATLKMMHFLGNADAAKKILDPSNDDKKMGDVFPVLNNSNNDAAAKMTVGEYKKSLEKRGFSFSSLSDTQIANANKATPATVTDTKMTAVKEDSGIMSGIKSYGKMSKIEGLVMHHTGGTGLKGAIATMKSIRKDGVQYAAHYLVDSDGSIYRIAPDDTILYHIGESNTNLNNGNSIGVEINASDSEHMTQEQINASVALGKFLKDKYGLKPENIKGHGETVKQGRKMATEGLAVAKAIRGEKLDTQSKENAELKGDNGKDVVIKNDKKVTMIGEPPAIQTVMAGSNQDYPIYRTMQG